MTVRLVQKMQRGIDAGDELKLAQPTTAKRGVNDCAEAAGAPFTDPRKSAALRKLRNSLIMMVDDEATSIEVTRELLHAAGYTRFVSTTDPFEAMGMLKALEPELLLLDLMMPGMSGLELLEHIEREGILKHVPAVIVTASTDVQSRFRALQLGATEFLTKPIDPAELVLRLSNTLAAKAYWSGCWEPPPSHDGAR
jgi:CheY-like chemotaxis protein